jgi:hypothetical protein
MVDAPGNESNKNVSLKVSIKFKLKVNYDKSNAENYIIPCLIRVQFEKIAPM